jgi:hypothetical protein
MRQDSYPHLLLLGFRLFYKRICGRCLEAIDVLGSGTLTIGRRLALWNRTILSS